MTDYSLWEVILNGDFPIPTRVIDGVVQPVAPNTTEQKLARKNELKARGTLLMALPDKYQLKFNIYKDAKTLMEAIKKRFGGNKETKKVQKTLLKQQFENFTGSSSESLDQIHDRLQKLISQLEILRESLSQEDINLKFLRSLPTEWKTHTLIWRNKTDLEDQSLDDIFNSLKIYEADVKISAVASVSAASTKVLISTLPNVDTLSDAVIYSFFASQSNSPQLDNDDLKQIDADDLEEMDLKWQMAMLTMRARRFLQRTGRNLRANGTTSTGFDMSKVECYNCHKRGHLQESVGHLRTTGIRRLKGGMFQWRLLRLMHWFHSVMVLEAMIGDFRQRKNQPTMPSWHSPLQVLLVLIMRKSQFDVISYKTGLESVEARILVYQQNETVFEEDIKLLKLDVQLRDNALVVLRKKFEKSEQERDELKLKLDKFQTSSKNLSQLLASQTNDKTGLGYDNQVFNSFVFDCDKMFSCECDVSKPTTPIYDRYKSREGYHDVPPPYIGTFMPPKPDLIFHDAPTVNETVPTAFNVEPSITKPTQDLSQSNRSSSPIIEDWVSDSEDESKGEPMTTQKAPSFVHTSKHVKTPRPSVKPVEHPIPAANLQTDIPKSRGHRNSRNRNACFICKSLTHLIKDYDYYEKKMVQKPVGNHARRGNHQHYARMTHPNPQRHVVPTAVLTKSRLVLLSAARPVNTTVPQTKVQYQRPPTHGVNKAHSPKRRPINRRPSSQASNCPQKFSTAKAPQVNVVQGVKRNWIQVSYGLGPKETLTFLFYMQGNPHHALKDKGVIDSGCSRHMTGNMSYLFDFEEINSGYVAFGGNPKGGKITGKGKIRIGKLDFDDVYFVKELKFNLFSVSQMCDKKNSVLFTDTECIVLSFDFKLPDENHVLLRVPRENNMYNTPYELLLGRTPSIGFMRPFGCPVTILNTLDPLGKFDGKADEGFLVGYSVSRSGPTWLFDIDTLTKSMNYQPVIAGNQPNPSAGIQEHIDADKNIDDDATFEVKELEFEVKEPNYEVHVSPSSSAKTKKHDDKTNREAKGKSPIDTPGPAVGQISTNNTNSFSAAGLSNTAVSPTLGKSLYVDPSQYPDDPNMPALEDITYSNDEEDVGAEADFSNLETNITISPIPTTRVHKDHPVT
nr:hypothetical protein [Tanacetum cinerariifolium]